MNLLQAPWMPVRDARGRREWISPDRLAEPQWRAFDADRPDFNGALAQFAIGLLQTTAQVTDVIAWRKFLQAAPDQATLRKWFEPVADAFHLGGSGPRFMQDPDLGVEGVAVNPIGALLIEAPGEQTVKNNADHFIKRAQVNALCPACAAIALFSLQTNAPAGGAGHRTGLRGGGPLTTLVMAPGDASLWQHLWMNVRDERAYLAQGGNAEMAEAQRSFPWLGPVSALQPPKGEIAQSQVHPSHLFWGMPRRIRLDLDHPINDRCDICERKGDALITRYATKNYGLNYKGSWSHPLSPYYETKEGWLPVHPQPGGLGYRHWLAWVMGAGNARSTTRPAQVVTRALQELPARITGGILRLWAFGYDMDNMKARCWYEATLPLFSLADCDRDTQTWLQAEVGRWIDGASLAGNYLRTAVKAGWFSSDARGDFSHVDASFWTATETPFYRQLQALVDELRGGIERDELAARQAWHRTLVHAVLHLFDHAFVGTGTIERQNPRRIALAHQQLRSSLHGSKLRQALGLPADPPARRIARKGTASTTAIAQEAA